MNEIGEYIQSKITDVCKQNAKEADRVILEYMAKRNLTLEDLQDNVVMQQEQDDPLDVYVTLKRTYWYKGELILKAKQKIDITQPLVIRCVMSIEKGDW